MYITGDVGSVAYVARVKEIMLASEATLSRPLASSTADQAPFDQHTRVGVFESESSSALSDPIPLATRVPYGLRYTDLESFRTVETITVI
jgi:hypothetical protein